MAKQYNDLTDLPRYRTAKAPPPGPYVVQVLGFEDYDDEDAEEPSLEISVVRENTHGRQSWGWGGKDKIILCDSDGGEYPRAIAEKIIALAHSLADDLNKE